MEIKRDRYLGRLVDRMHNGMVKVVTGVRRCGKTYLLFNLFGSYLRSSGVEDSHIIELALDDEKNAEYRDPNALSAHLQSLIVEKQGRFYLLLDDVQYAISDEELKRADQPPGLYGVLDGLLRMQNVDVYVTSSNSKLLSTDVMTQLRGCGDEVRIRPLSFAEFMQGFAGNMYQGWAEYLIFGGMPLILSMRTDEQKTRYLEDLFNEICLKDIVARKKMSKTQEFEDLVNVLALNIGTLTNPPRLEAVFKNVLHSKISENTIAAYIGYLEEAFLIEECSRYNVKGCSYIGSPKKYYFEDTGLRNARLNFRQVEHARLMENIIYNELRARGYSVDIGIVEKRGKNKGKDYRESLEVDFVANLGSVRYYLQSVYWLPDEGKATREKVSLREINDSFKKIILVSEVMKPTHDKDGILTMSVYDFLLNEDSLEW